jgi:hypothetical protein
MVTLRTTCFKVCNCVLPTRWVLCGCHINLRCGMLGLLLVLKSLWSALSASVFKMKMSNHYFDCLNLVVEVQLRFLQTSVTADQSMSLTS